MTGMLLGNLKSNYCLQKGDQCGCGSSLNWPPKEISMWSESRHTKRTNTFPSLLYPPRARKLALEVACSSYSDSWEDAKEKATRKIGGVGKRKKEGREILGSLCSPQIPPVLFLCLRFLNSPDYLGAWTLRNRFV